MSENHRTEVHQGADDQWYWRRRAANGEIVATGEGYTRQDDAIESANANFPDDVMEVLEDIAEDTEEVI